MSPVLLKPWQARHPNRRVVLTPKKTLAIVLGVSECPRAPNLQHLPQCANSAADFVQYLHERLELPDENVIDLFDSPLHAGEQIEKIEDWLNQHERRPNTDLFLYYTGHGGFTRSDQAYFLAVRRTRAGSEGATSIRYVDLASTIKRHAASLRKYLILDCCFAASAVVLRAQTNLNQLVMDRVEDELPSSGTAVLCSSAAKFVSLAPEGERYTMFSGALLECLRSGIPEGPKLLSLEQVGLRTQQIIRTKFPNDAVRPELHVPEQHLGNPARIPLFPNKSVSPQLSEPEPEPVFQLETKPELKFVSSHSAPDKKSGFIDDARSAIVVLCIAAALGGTVLYGIYSLRERQIEAEKSQTTIKKDDPQPGSEKYPKPQLMISIGKARADRKSQFSASVVVNIRISRDGPFGYAKKLDCRAQMKAGTDTASPYVSKDTISVPAEFMAANPTTEATAEFVVVSSDVDRGLWVRLSCEDGFTTDWLSVSL
jgi:hypothetical protein